MSLLVVLFWLHNRQLQNDMAWYQLGAAQGDLIQGRLVDARKALDEWNQHYSGSSATAYAKFLQADLLYKTSDYVTAAQIYGDLAQTAPAQDMRPLALSAQASAEEMAGHNEKALALAQSFTTLYPDHFFASSAYMAQARLDELAGNRAGAAAIYDRFIILYPQSPLLALAKARQQALAGSAPVGK